MNGRAMSSSIAGMESAGRPGENGPPSDRAWYDSVNDWFAAFAGPHDNPKQVVQQFLRQNFPARAVNDPEAEVLVVENQGVWLWGRRHRDGAFLERENESGQPWMLLAEDEVAFWLHHAAFEAAWSMPCHRSGQLAASDRQRIQDLTAALPFDRWVWPGAGSELRARGKTVAWVCGDDEPWVIVAAPTEDELDWLDALGCQWEQDSRSSPPNP